MCVCVFVGRYEGSNLLRTIEDQRKFPSRFWSGKVPGGTKEFVPVPVGT